MSNDEILNKFYVLESQIVEKEVNMINNLDISKFNPMSIPLVNTSRDHNIRIDSLESKIEWLETILKNQEHKLSLLAPLIKRELELEQARVTIQE